VTSVTSVPAACVVVAERTPFLFLQSLNRRFAVLMQMLEAIVAVEQMQEAIAA
jgi:hypothetical protein